MLQIITGTIIQVRSALWRTFLSSYFHVDRNDYFCNVDCIY